MPDLFCHSRWSQRLAFLVIAAGLSMPVAGALAYSLINLNTLIESNVDVSVSSTTVEINNSATTGAPVMEPVEVSTDADLEAYAGGLIASDEALEEIKFTGESVEVRYKQKGRLLALVPITFMVTAVANAGGTVEIEYPWFSVLTVDNEEEVLARARVAVDNALRAKAVGSVRGEGESASPRFTAAESATVAAGLHSVLRSSFESQNSLDTINEE